MPLRVLIDATAVPPDLGGVGRYVEGLIRGLTELSVNLTLVCRAAAADGCRGQAPGARVIAGPRLLAARPARLAWEQTALPRLMADVGADLLHSPHYTMPLVSSRPVVVTLHDATFFTHPELHTPVKRGFFRAATHVALRRAALCVVPSAATREELARVAGGEAARIAVAHHGVDRDRFRRPTRAETERVARRLGLDGARYIAFLGTLEPRKNVPALIRGWVLACQDRDDPPALVLAGASGWDDNVDDAVASVPPQLRVLRPGYLPLEELPGLLGGAEVVAYPSLGEGFGLPVLEAMACGAAVLTSRHLALPEVGGDAVAYCGTRPEEIAAELAALLDDPLRRRRLGEAGAQRAAIFTWRDAAQAHLRAYERALL